MFLPRILMICTGLALEGSAQSYYHGAGAGGYTSVRHGQGGAVHSPPSTQQYSRPAPFVHHQLQQQQHHQLHQPVRQNYQQQPGSECRLDYVERSGEVCVPTFTTDCDKEEVDGGLVIKHKEECYSVTKTVCTETTDISDMEVCANRLNLISLEAEAKIVTAVWTEDCQYEKVCLPVPAVGYHSSPGCAEAVRHICSQIPSLVPVSKTVSLKLPQPVETCIIKQVLLPRIECQQVKERRCMMAPRTAPGPKYQLDKCSVEVEGQQCSEVVLQLPRQGCPSRVNRTLSHGYTG